MSVSSQPWLRPPCHCIDPSTRPNVYHDEPGSLLDRNKVEFPVILGAGLVRHKPRVNSSDNPCGSLVRGCSVPIQQNVGVSIKAK